MRITRLNKLDLRPASSKFVLESKTISLIRSLQFPRLSTSWIDFLILLKFEWIPEPFGYILLRPVMCGNLCRSEIPVKFRSVVFKSLTEEKRFDSKRFPGFDPNDNYFNNELPMSYTIFPNRDRKLYRKVQNWEKICYMKTSYSFLY